MTVSRRSFLGGSIASISLLFGGFGWKESDLLRGKIPKHEAVLAYDWGDLYDSRKGDKKLWVHGTANVDQTTGVCSPIRMRYWAIDDEYDVMQVSQKTEISEQEARSIASGFVDISRKTAEWSVKRAAEGIVDGIV